MLSRRNVEAQHAQYIKAHSFVTYLFLSILFIYIATPTEVVDNTQAAGIVFFSKIVACAILFYSVRKIDPAPIPDAFLLLAVIISGYMLIINIFQYSNYGVISPVGMLIALLIAAQRGFFARETYAKLARNYILFHIFGLGGAIAIYKLTGQIIDLHSVLFPFSISRAHETFGLARLCGFQIEPGTYANFVYLVVLFRSLTIGRVASWLHAVAMGSTVATLAAWSVIGFGIFLLAAFVEVILYNKRATLPIKAFMISLAFGGALALITSYSAIGDNGGMINYFQLRFSGGDESGSAVYKIEAFQALTQAIGDTIVVGRPVSISYCEYCVSPQDLGVILNLTYYFGVIPTMLLCFAVIVNVFRYFGFGVLLFFAPLVVCKAFFFDPLIWLVLGCGLFPLRFRNTGRCDLRSSGQILMSDRGSATVSCQNRGRGRATF